MALDSLVVGGEEPGEPQNVQLGHSYTAKKGSQSVFD